MKPRTITDKLIVDLQKLRFGKPVTHVYNPLLYARRSYDEYWDRYGRGPKEIVFLGMNPGPWGMAQTGIPFGEVAAVKSWLGIETTVDRPSREHPKRPVAGFGCPKSEVSGRRLWGWAAKTFGTPEKFFRRFFVLNYCPLLFIEASGRNRTPDSLPVAERRPLFAACDRALVRFIQYLKPAWVIGVGKFAEKRAQEALVGLDLREGGILHPSPANPLANKGWEGLVNEQLRQLEVLPR
jgi:single-strand selective monofunctional uracil DNA glycosylase